MNTRLIWWSVCSWVVVIGCFLFSGAIAQTNDIPRAPDLSPLDPAIFPQGKEATWLALIPPITFTITWLLGKIPPLPKELLPWLTPVIGILIGLVMEYATKQNWPWWSAAGAGAIAVTIYEGVKEISGASVKSALTPTPKPPNP